MALSEDLALISAPEEREPFRFYAEDEHPEPEMLVLLDFTGAFPLGDISVISGKAKTGKSYCVSIIISSVLGCTAFGFTPMKDNAKVLYFDTEQSSCNIARIQRRIHRLMGWDVATSNQNLIFYELRELALEQRFGFILEKVLQYEPEAIVIDGIADLINNFNDIAESQGIITRLLDMCSRENVALITVLHENKGKDDTGMKGHLGTMLLQKAASVFHLTTKGDKYIVENTDCRNKSIRTFSFTIDDFGMPVSAETEAEAQHIASVNKLREEMQQVFADNTTRTYNKLIQDYRQLTGLSERTAKYKISNASECGIIKGEGSGRCTIYRLCITS